MVKNVAHAVGDHVSPIVKAVRTSPVGAVIDSILPGIFGEGGAAEEVKAVKLLLVCQGCLQGGQCRFHTPSNALNLHLNQPAELAAESVLSNE